MQHVNVTISLKLLSIWLTVLQTQMHTFWKIMVVQIVNLS